jgi:flagellin
MTGFGLGVDTAVQNIANSIIANFVDAETISVQAGTDGSAASVIELAFPVNVTAHALGVDDTAITTAAGALDALAQLDEALHAVNGHQADLGASQNRLEATLNHQQAAIEASTRSEGVIMDADYALELSDLAKHQVLGDARRATLAQARQLESSTFAALMS